ATGTLANEIAREGGLGSVFWTGGKNLTDDGSFDPKFRTDGFRRGEGAPRLKLGVELDLEDFAPRYEIEIGFPVPKQTAAFPLEAQIKLEKLDFAERGRRILIMERKNAAVWTRDDTGTRRERDEALLASETALASLGGVPELVAARQALSAWRF